MHIFSALRELGCERGTRDAVVRRAVRKGLAFEYSSDEERH
jgi:hypothetical protein